MEQDDQQEIANLPDLEVLRGRLEQQEAAKLKAEQIVSTLSRIKAREKASRRRLSSRDETSIISSGDKKSHSAPNSAVKEKSNLLKRKLEEDRAKVESQRGSESLDKVNEVVETIKAQLEDRGKLMQQLLLNARQQQLHHELIKGSDDDDKSAIELPSEPELPDEIQQKIATLEAKIIDLQENLKEKDEVISARTKAITLLSEDMSRKSKSTLDTLEETQEQMRQMQNNFISIEDKMKKEHQRLKEEAEDRKQRCLQAEKNLRIVEAARFDLSARVAELQEKVVALQTKNIELEKNINESEMKQNELKDALEAARNTAIKTKAQFKIKMKALEEERDLLKKTTDDGNAGTSLQERIAELEEEKEHCSLLKNRVSELEEMLSQQGDDLDSHVKALSKLELEKLDLIQVVQERNCLLTDKDILINQLQQQIDEIKQLKVSAEMRAIDLEEKLDAIIKDKINEGFGNEVEMSHLKQLLIVQEETIKDLQMKLSERHSELAHKGEGGGKLVELNSQLEEWKKKYLYMESKYINASSLFNSLESRLEKAEESNELIVIECNKLRATVAQLQNVITDISSQERSKPINFHASTSVSDSSVVKTSDSDAEKDLEINRLREELAAASMELHKLSTALDNMRLTSQQVDELNKQIIEKDKVLTDVNNELEKRTRKLSEYKKFHKLKSEDVLRVSHELETVTVTSQEKILELERDIAEARNKEIVMENQIKELKEYQLVSQVQQNDQTQKMKKLAANLKLKVKTCKELEEKLEEYKKKLEEKENLIQELIKKESSYLLEISQLKSFSIEKSSELEPTSDVSNKLESLLSEKDHLNSKVLDQQKIIYQLENEIKMIREERESAFSQLEKMQENEFTKNDELFKRFETQVIDSKTEIQVLQDQLIDFQSKYEQAWAKLQEKEAYIESVEGELSKVQNKMQAIESSSEEMRRDLKEKTELLGERLKKAEEANEQFEMRRNEIEQSFTDFANREMFLKNSLAEKNTENGELKQINCELNNRVELLEKESNNTKNYIINLQNENAHLNNVKNAHNHSLEEIEKLNNDIKQLKLYNERIITELKENERINVEILENELKSFDHKCNTIESERHYLLKECENLRVENHSLKEKMDKLKSEFESKVSCIESDKNHYEDLYSKLRSEVTVQEKSMHAISESKSKEIEGIMTEQRLLLERLHADFKQKEDSYYAKIQEQEAYNIKLQESLQAIESSAEHLKCELNKVGLELSSSKEELVALKSDQEKTLNLKNELEKIRDNCYCQLEEERELVRSLKFQLLREKTKKEIDDVVREAEVKVDSMSQAHHLESSPPLFKFSESDLGDIAKSFDIIAQQPTLKQEVLSVSQDELGDINGLKHQLNLALQENEKLTAIVNQSNSYKQSVESEVVANVTPNLFINPPCRVKNKDEEDGWGWGCEEVMMEQETATTVVGPPGNQYNTSQVDIRISMLEQKLHEAEADNVRLCEELKGSQVRCSKLIKKAKELKAKNEGLERETREKSVGFEDLDFAMQEELRAQIEKLQKNLQETLNENKFLKSEKENYVRKIDTLFSGNERLVDMKERQDIELSMFQKQNSDLKQQILGFEWKIEELMEDHERLTTNCTEMEEKINSLASENEQLMKIVGDMKDQQKMGGFHGQEAKKVQEFNENPIFTMFRDNVCNEPQTLKENVHTSLLQDYECLSVEKNDILTINSELKVKVDTFNARINELEIENYDLKNKIENIKMSSDSEMNENTHLLKENERLIRELSVNVEKLKAYEEKLKEFQSDNEKLEVSLVSLRNCILSLEEQNHIIKIDLENKYESLLREFNVINDQLLAVKEEKDCLHKRLLEIEREKSNDELSNKQIGATVMFHGFTDDGSSGDPFLLTQEDTTEKHVPDLPKFKGWDAIDQTKSESSNTIRELKEQVSALTTLLQEKEMELEISKQSLDNLKLESENLRDVWSKKYEDLKMEQSKKYDDLKTVGSKKSEHLPTEQATVNGDNSEAYEQFLSVAEQKYKDTLLTKDEEIAHLTCELSAKEQQLISIKKEVTNLKNIEKQLNESIERYKFEYETQQKVLNESKEDGVKLQAQLEELVELKQNHESKLNDTDLKYKKLQVQYDNCLKTLKDETKIKTVLEQNYSTCRCYLEDKERVILEKEKLLAESNVKIEKLNDLYLKQSKETSDGNDTITAELQIQKQCETVTALVPSSVTSNLSIISSEVPNYGCNMNEEIVKYKDMLKQRDIEIEKLMQTVGEAEERLIKAEEMRLSGEEGSILKMRLDEALYTLHLRDVRCEELTHELMQLLEERDTLQLRLSTAIRLNEELRRKATPSIPATTSCEQPMSITNNSSSCTTRTSSIEHNQSSSDLETTQSDSEGGRLDRLNEKLGELHNIGYQRDLSLHQDRIKRHSEQMHLYSPGSSPQQSLSQQSINDDSYTSGGFFSWIFGSNGSSSNTQVDV